MDLIKTLAKNGLIDQLASRFGLDAKQVEGIIEKGLPSITNQINKNTSEENGMNNFANALKDHKDRDVSSMVQDTNQINSTEGGKILNHIFGNRKAEVEDEISSSENVSQDKVNEILKLVAPIVMVIIAKKVFGQRKEKELPTSNNNTNSENRNKAGFDIGRQETEVEEAKSGIPSILESIFDKDKDNDGGILGDILGKIF